MYGNNIILVGFMGTGKSTAGKLLAARLGWSFIDTDKQIEQEHGVSIGQLFEQQGEAVFRTIESDTLQRVVAGSEQVIATGGGAVLAERNRHTMLNGGFVVALKANQAVIVGRVSHDTGRPLLRGDVEQRVSALLEQRKTAYDFAHFIIDTSELTSEQVAEQIADQWKANRAGSN